MFTWIGETAKVGPTAEHASAYAGGLGVVVVVLVILVFWFHFMPYFRDGFTSEGLLVQNPGQAMLTGQGMQSTPTSNTNAAIMNPTASRSAGNVRDDRFAPTPFPYPSGCAYDPSGRSMTTQMVDAAKQQIAAEAAMEGLAKQRTDAQNKWAVGEYMSNGNGQTPSKALYTNPGQQDVIGDAGSVYAGGAMALSEQLQLRAYGAA